MSIVGLLVLALGELVHRRRDRLEHAEAGQHAVQHGDRHEQHHEADQRDDEAELHRRPRLDAAQDQVGLARADGPPCRPSPAGLATWRLEERAVVAAGSRRPRRRAGSWPHGRRRGRPRPARPPPTTPCPAVRVAWRCRPPGRPRRRAGAARSAPRRSAAPPAGRVAPSRCWSPACSRGWVAAAGGPPAGGWLTVAGRARLAPPEFAWLLITGLLPGSARSAARQRPASRRPATRRSGRGRRRCPPPRGSSDAPPWSGGRDCLISPALVRITPPADVIAKTSSSGFTMTAPTSLPRELTIFAVSTPLPPRP